MSDSSENPEICAVCGKPCDDEQAVAHVNRDGRRIAICFPDCFERFERGLGKAPRAHGAEEVATAASPPGTW